MSAITFTPQQLRALQLTQLGLLCEVDRICRKHEINYSIIGGTLLGAVRHKGFIPWDDDADIVFLRDDYSRFAEIFPIETDSAKYYFQDAGNSPGYRWGYGKVRRKGTLFLRAGQEHMSFGQEIYIDIFPLDKLPSGIIKEPLHNLHCFIIRKVLWSEVGKCADKNAFFRFAYGLLSKIPKERVFRHYYRFINKHNTDKNHLLRVITFPTPHGYAYEGDIEWYSDFTEMEFEGHMFMVLKGFENFLKLKYGDYMKLPPPSERPKLEISKLVLPE